MDNLLSNNSIASLLQQNGEMDAEVNVYSITFKQAMTLIGFIPYNELDTLDFYKPQININSEVIFTPYRIKFPMFEMTEEAGLTAMHHPFTAPKNVTPEQLIADPMSVYADAYDLVINGYESGGGSVRIYDENMQNAVFTVLGISKEEAREKFGFLLDALSFGAPPHAGLAFGLDRVTMLITGTDNIRDVIAFPKTTAAACLMTDAPNVASSEALNELAIAVTDYED